MSDFNFKEEPQPVVIAEKNFFKGQIFGYASNGGGIINIGNGKSLKFIALNDKFVTIQVLEHGIGVEVKTSSWTKSKKVIEKKIVEKIVKVPVKKEEEQIKFNIDEEVEELF